MSFLYRISVWWNVIGVAVIVAILLLVPSHLQSFSFVFGHRINNSGFGNHMYWYYVLPLGFLLTMYTITGYDASAHVSEETTAPPSPRPRGSGVRSSTRPSSADSCCWRSRLRPSIRTR